MNSHTHSLLFAVLLLLLATPPTCAWWGHTKHTTTEALSTHYGLLDNSTVSTPYKFKFKWLALIILVILAILCTLVVCCYVLLKKCCGSIPKQDPYQMIDPDGRYYYIHPYRIPEANQQDRGHDRKRKNKYGGRHHRGGRYHDDQNELPEASISVSQKRYSRLDRYRRRGDKRSPRHGLQDEDHNRHRHRRSSPRRRSHHQRDGNRRSPYRVTSGLEPKKSSREGDNRRKSDHNPHHKQRRSSLAVKSAEGLSPTMPHYASDHPGCYMPTSADKYRYLPHDRQSEVPLQGCADAPLPTHHQENKKDRRGHPTKSRDHRSSLTLDSQDQHHRPVIKSIYTGTPEEMVQPKLIRQRPSQKQQLLSLPTATTGHAAHPSTLTTTPSSSQQTQLPTTGSTTTTSPTESLILSDDSSGPRSYEVSFSSSIQNKSEEMKQDSIRRSDKPMEKSLPLTAPSAGKHGSELRSIDSTMGKSVEPHQYPAHSKKWG